MRKILVLLSLIIIALFVVSCVPKEGDEENDVKEIEVEDSALAGQAISGTCNDPDGVSTYDIAQVFKKSNTTKGTGKWVDQCQTVNGKVILKEGICTNGKLASWQYSCSKLNKLPGDKYECVDDACVNKGTICTPKCEGKTCGDNSCNGVCGECGDDEKCENSQCVMLNPTCTPGSTVPENWDCVKKYGSYNVYTKEMQYANCTKYYSNNDEDQKWCGSTADSCAEDKGCCVGTVSSYCEGNVFVNQTENLCTGVPVLKKKDCLLVNGSVNKNPQVCGTKISALGKQATSCYESCTPGEVITSCYEPNNCYEPGKCNAHQNLICNSDGLEYKWSSSASSCPTGTTCQKKDQWENGVCK